MSLDFI